MSRAPAPRPVSLRAARRLAVACQGLSGPRPRPDAASVLQVVRDLGCLQMDPIGAVARSQELVLWSRLGPHARTHLDDLLYRDRSLFQYWAHAASIVPTDDFPIHAATMRAHRDPARWRPATRRWLAANVPLRRRVLARLRRAGGPLPARDVGDPGPRRRSGMGWGSESDVATMLECLWIEGRVLVAGRDGNGRTWDLAERHLPGRHVREALREPALTREAVTRSLRALGAGTARQIAAHFTRRRYARLPEVLRRMVAEGAILPVEIRDDGPRPLGGTWYVLHDRIPLLERIEAGSFEPRTVLLSPFDNLLCDRNRTEQLFGFRFRVEIYVPRAKRTHGYYVMPLLHGDALVGQLDMAMDRAGSVLCVKAVHAEPGAPEEAGGGMRAAVADLAAHLGAGAVAWPAALPAPWRSRAPAG